MIQSFYRELFRAEDCSHCPHIPNGFPTLSFQQSVSLTLPFSREEIKRALFNMAPSKATGVDGFHADFLSTLLRDYWIFCLSVCSRVSRFGESSYSNK